MSVEIHWDTLTGGSKGDELAEKIRSFIHERFQQISLPRFISSVKVHSFDFGDAPPEVEIKDVCDPLGEFYEDEDEEGEGGEDEKEPNADAEKKAQGQELGGIIGGSHGSHEADSHHGHSRGVSGEIEHVPSGTAAASLAENQQPAPSRPVAGHYSTEHPTGIHSGPLSPLFIQHTTGASNAAYFHLPYGTGLSGRTTPLAAVASGQFHGGWPDIIHTSTGQVSNNHATTLQPHPMSQSLGRSREHSESVSSSMGISSSDPASSRPHSQHLTDPSISVHDLAQQLEHRVNLEDSNVTQRKLQSIPARDPNDLQIVAHVRYSGNMSLVMTADILVDYPMPSFVGIPLQLHITGFSFDGVAILAHADKKLHFCFLSPEDADTFLGAPQKQTTPADEDGLDATDQSNEEQERRAAAGSREGRLGGLLEEIRVESEIGDKVEGKQVLKNVGKVERFVLEQVQRIFEDEFVFPSFWTVLV